MIWQEIAERVSNWKFASGLNSFCVKSNRNW